MRRLHLPKPSSATTSNVGAEWPSANSSRTFSPTIPNSHAPSLTKVGISSSRTNMRSAGKFAARAVRLFLPLSMRSPASRSRSRLRSDSRPERWSAMCRRVRSTDIIALQRVDRPAVALERLLPQEAPDAHDGRRADPRAFVNVAVRQIGAIEQPGDVPALRQRPEFRGRAQVAKQLPQLLASPRRQQCVAQLVRKLVDVPRRLNRALGHWLVPTC